MSEIKAIEKLRDYANEHIINGPLMNAMIDEIEREIAERYMKAPVDADGVPIHVGDKLVNGVGDGIIYTVAKLKFDGRYWWYESGDGCFSCDGAKHKPRTLEDVLEDFAIGVCEEDGFSEEHVRCCADEIRAMFGVVAISREECPEGREIRRRFK